MSKVSFVFLFSPGECILAEFDFRYSNRQALEINDTARADIALTGIVGKRLTYQTVGV